MIYPVRKPAFTLLSPAYRQAGAGEEDEGKTSNIIV